jgi:hypothetical protein
MVKEQVTYKIVILAPALIVIPPPPTRSMTVGCIGWICRVQQNTLVPLILSLLTTRIVDWDNVRGIMCI